MSVMKKVTLGTAWQVGAKIIGTLLGVVALGIMTRGLGPAGFGYYSVTIAFLQFFGIGVDLGLNVMTPKLMAEASGVSLAERTRLFSNLMGLRLASALLALALAPLVALFFDYPPVVHVAIAITTFSFLAIVVNQILVGFFQSELVMKWVAVGEIVGRVVLVVGVALAAWFERGLVAFMAAIVAGSIINFFIVMIAARQRLPFSFSFDLMVWKKIMQRAWPIGLAVVLNLVYLRADTIILSLHWPAAEVGYYGAAYRILDLVAMFPPMVAALVLPLMARAHQIGDRDRVQKLFQNIFKIFLLLAVPLVVITPFVAPWFINLVAGSDFEASSPLLTILMIAGGVIFFGNLVGYTITALDLQKKFLPAYAVTAVVILTGYLIFIPRYGATAAAWFTVLSESMITFFGFFVLARYAKIFPRLTRGISLQ